MNIEEKIREAAEHYIDNCVEVTNCECAWQTVDNAFKEGANFALEEAFRWREVKTEPPKEIGETYYILVTNDPNNEHDTRLFAFRHVKYLVKTRKYWRPINLEDL